MIQDAKMYALRELIAPDMLVTYFIPKYQREYVWKQKNWEALFDDLLEQPSGHFLGSVICVDKQIDAIQGSILELIDGQQRFLRHYYNAFKHDPKVKIEGVRRANKSNLINLYESVIKRDGASFFADFEQKSRLYSYMINVQVIPVDWSKEAKQLAIDLQRLGAAPAYTFLLWALDFSATRSWDIGKCFELLARYLLSWFVRRSLTDTPPTRELDTLFEGVIEHLSKLPLINSLEDLVAHTIAELEKKAASIEMVQEKLYGPIYQNNTDITRFLLCKLEELHFTDERTPHLWERNEQKRYLWTIEHIFPEGENIPQSWIDMVANGNKEEAITLHNRIVHSLGNLTLSGYNGNLSNRSFTDKRDLKNEKGNWIGYRNGLYLNNEVVCQEVWDEQMIQERTKKLADEITDWLGLYGEVEGR